MVDEERIKTEDVLSHYQNLLADREKKINDLTRELQTITESIHGIYVGFQFPILFSYY
jgi:hypothetical protein